MGNTLPAASRIYVSASKDEYLSAAQEAGLPIVNDPQLTAVLVGLPMGKAIPEQLYTTVAKVIGAIHRARARAS